MHTLTLCFVIYAIVGIAITEFSLYHDRKRGKKADVLMYLLMVFTYPFLFYKLYKIKRAAKRSRLK